MFKLTWSSKSALFRNFERSRAVFWKIFSHFRVTLNTSLRSFQHWNRLVYQRWLRDCRVQHQNIRFQRSLNRIGRIQHLRWKPICAFWILEHNRIWRQSQEHSHSWNPIRLVWRRLNQQVDRMYNGLLVESKVYLCTWQNFRLFYFIIWNNHYFQLQSYPEDMRPAVILNYESSFGEYVGGTTWVQTSLDRPNFCDIIICWHTISFEENSILRKIFMSVKFFEMKIGILILNSDFMREICYSGKIREMSDIQFWE